MEYGTDPNRKAIDFTKEARIAIPNIAPVKPGLELTITVNVVRINRGVCPRCAKRRVLFKLSAFGAQAVGDGKARCGPCAGLTIYRRGS